MCITKQIHFTSAMNLAFLLFFLIFPLVSGHGKILMPPGRGTLWRFGHPTPVNWDDDGNFCGGYSTLWLLNDGKCGVCGDAYNGPRDHEVGGKYYSGVIGATYQQGQTIDILLQITANHRGFFQFSLCPNADNKTEVTQECLDSHILDIEGHGKKYNISSPDQTLEVELKLTLPEDVKCDHCVLQWHWRTSNFWGMCDNDTGALGCGPQEVYRNCADISIKPKTYVGEPFDNSLNDAMLNYVKQPWFEAIQALRKQNYRAPAAEHKYPVTYLYGYPVGLNWQFRSISP
uniref:Chitin-binding type-4 domain-containing protein n=1 Tax=Strigamia maritima TaxID=126957 RepID=T1JL38_STRMM